VSNGDLQREFVYGAISDISGTIRAIDTKLHIVLGIFLIPLAMVDKVLEAVCYWCSRWNWSTLCAMQWATSATALVATGVWCVGVIMSLRGIIALANPGNAVPVDGRRPQGTFYFVGQLRGWLRPKLRQTLEAHIGKLPGNDQMVLRELAYEQMKLGFIRDVKMRRHRISACVAVGWGVLVVTTAVMYHVAIWK
jgi:hypothetical protein